MPHEVYADPIPNYGPGFHSDVPIIKLTERVTRAIEASDISSAPPVVETMDGVMHETQLTPTEPNRTQGLKMPNASTAPRSTTLTRLIPRHA